MSLFTGTSPNAAAGRLIIRKRSDDALLYGKYSGGIKYVSTDDAGRYRVYLPAGTYDIVFDPRDSSLDNSSADDVTSLAGRSPATITFTTPVKPDYVTRYATATSPAVITVPGAGGGVAAPAGSLVANIQTSTGAWTKSKATIDELRASGAVVYWVTDAAVNVPPAAADGLMDGDLVNGSLVGEGAPDVPPQQAGDMTLLFSDTPMGTGTNFDIPSTNGPAVDNFAGAGQSITWTGHNDSTTTPTGQRIRRMSDGSTAWFECYNRGRLHPNGLTLPASGDVEVEFLVKDANNSGEIWTYFMGNAASSQVTRVSVRGGTDNSSFTISWRSDVDGQPTTVALASGVPALTGSFANKVRIRIGSSGLTVWINDSEVGRVPNAMATPKNVDFYSGASMNGLFRKVIVRGSAT